MILKVEIRLRLLLFVDLIFILLNLFYICSPMYLGYYLIGIIQTLLIIFSIVLLVFQIIEVIETKKIRTRDIIIIVIAIISIIIIGYSTIIWYLFMPK